MDSVFVHIDQISSAFTCSSEVIDTTGRVLAGGGTRFTRSFINDLFQRGIRIVGISSSDLMRSADNVIRMRDAVPDDSYTSAREPRAVSLVSRRKKRCHEPYSAERTGRFTSQLGVATNLMLEIGEQIRRLTRPALAELCHLPLAFSTMLLEDTDQAIAACEITNTRLCLARRCAQMSTLAMATGIEMGLRDTDILLLGRTALLHDLSLFELPEHLWNPTCPLTEDEQRLYEEHPARSVALLGDQPYISDETRALILQVHQLGGQGHGQAWKSPVCPSRLLNILQCVELYLALVYPGPGRLGIVPHDVLGLLLQLCHRRILDHAVMRSMLNQLSLFPIGSRVMVNEDQPATVMRRNENRYHTPIVRVDNASEDNLLSLSERDRVIAVPAETQCRIEKSSFRTIELHTLLK